MQQDPNVCFSESIAAIQTLAHEDPDEAERVLWGTVVQAFQESGATDRKTAIRLVEQLACRMAPKFDAIAHYEPDLRFKYVWCSLGAHRAAVRRRQQSPLPPEFYDALLKFAHEEFQWLESLRICLAKAIEAHVPHLAGMDARSITEDWWPGRLAATGKELRELAARARARSGEDRREQPIPERFTVAKLRNLTGLKNSALNKYQAIAGVLKAGKGKRNHTFSRDDVRRILTAISERSSDGPTLNQCRRAMEQLESGISKSH